MPALGDAQAHKLLEAPSADTLKGVRDRAILATLLYHGIRRDKAVGHIMGKMAGKGATFTPLRANDWQ